MNHRIHRIYRTHSRVLNLLPHSYLWSRAKLSPLEEPVHSSHSQSPYRIGNRSVRALPLTEPVSGRILRIFLRMLCTGRMLPVGLCPKNPADECTYRLVPGSLAIGCYPETCGYVNEISITLSCFPAPAHGLIARPRKNYIISDSNAFCTCNRFSASW